VIDDEAPIRLLCRVNLEAEKMEVVEAKDGPTGLEEAKRTDPDVILLDVMMPMLDGWRVAEHLLDDPSTKDIPIKTSKGAASRASAGRPSRGRSRSHFTRPR